MRVEDGLKEKEEDTRKLYIIQRYIYYRTVDSGDDGIEGRGCEKYTYNTKVYIMQKYI
jgi:hypothetical protein